MRLVVGITWMVGWSGGDSLVSRAANHVSFLLLVLHTSSTADKHSYTHVHIYVSCLLFLWKMCLGSLCVSSLCLASSCLGSLCLEVGCVWVACIRVVVYWCDSNPRSQCTTVRLLTWHHKCDHHCVVSQCQIREHLYTGNGDMRERWEQCTNIQ